MKIIGGNRFALDAEAGEEITVTVESSGTAHLVNYIVQGAQPLPAGTPSEGHMTKGVPLRFKLQAAPADSNMLSLGFAFATPEEVAGEPVPDTVQYRVEVRSNAPNSDVSRDVVSGSFGIPADGRDWEFFL